MVDQNETMPEGGDDEAEFRKEEGMDRNIASMMAKMPFYNEKMIATIAKTQNPSSLGMLAAQAIIGVREKMIERGFEHSPRIWTAENGVLDNVIDDIVEVAQSVGVQVEPEQVFQSAVQVLDQYDKSGKGKAAQEGAPQEGAQPEGAPAPEGAPPPQAGPPAQGGPPPAGALGGMMR